jgi:hypothetical protein
MELDRAARSHVAINPDIPWTCPDIDGFVQIEPKALDWTSRILHTGVHVRRGLMFERTLTFLGPSLAREALQSAAVKVAI